LLIPITESVCAEDFDEMLADGVRKGSLLETPGDLSPLPLMGIPGWWDGGEQDDEFYADGNVFRVPANK
jgi:hypothetical protein